MSPHVRLLQRVTHRSSCVLNLCSSVDFIKTEVKKKVALVCFVSLLWFVLQPVRAPAGALALSDRQDLQVWHRRCF